MPNKIDKHNLKQRRIPVWGEIDEAVAYNLHQELTYMVETDKTKPITILIHSVGGCVSSLSSMIDDVEFAKNSGVIVNTVACGEAFSAAAILLAFGSVGNRYVRKNTTVMLHPISYSVEADYAEYQEKYTEFAKVSNEDLLKSLCKQINKPYKKLIKDIDKGLWLNASQAISYGIVDKILYDSLYLGDDKHVKEDNFKRRV